MKTQYYSMGHRSTLRSIFILFVCMVSFNGCNEEETVAPSKQELPEKSQEKTRHTELILDNTKVQQIAVPTQIKRIEPAGDFLTRFYDHQLTPDKKSRELFGNLTNIKVSSPKQASNVAFYYKMQRALPHAQERDFVVGLSRMGRDVQDFASKGDFIWVVRYLAGAAGTNDEIWVSSTTGACISILKANPRPRVHVK